MIKVLETLIYGNSHDQYIVNEVDACPRCHFAIKPTKIHLHPYWESGSRYIAGLYLCSHCHEPFVTFSVYTNESDRINNVTAFCTDLIYAGPTKYIEAEYDHAISEMSPQFVKIYNQAAAAESEGLDEVAGIGYRKAIEFLVKDFCIHLHTDESESIKGKLLSRCINDYIDNPQIKTLAERAAWIGNDETHYIRKQEDRDVNDMKNFIKAMVYFVGMVLIAEDAATMSPA